MTASDEKSWLTRLRRVSEHRLRSYSTVFSPTRLVVFDWWIGYVPDLCREGLKEINDDHG